MERTIVDDVETARRVAAGDEAAFDRLYAATVPRVFSLCLRMAGDAERARSLTQETFVRAWQRMASFRGDASLASWLHRIAVNVALEDGRRRQRWGRLVLASDDAVAAAPGRADDPALRVDLERAVAALPPGARRMLVLRDIEGHTYEDIAGLTGVSVGTVKSQVSRARRLLRETLDPS